MFHFSFPIYYDTPKTTVFHNIIVKTRVVSEITLAQHRTNNIRLFSPRTCRFLKTFLWQKSVCPNTIINETNRKRVGSITTDVVNYSRFEISYYVSENIILCNKYFTCKDLTKRSQICNNNLQLICGLIDNICALIDTPSQTSGPISFELHITIDRSKNGTNL